jgi:hypothetical protein
MKRLKNLIRFMTNFMEPSDALKMILVKTEI